MTFKVTNKKALQTHKSDRREMLILIFLYFAQWVGWICTLLHRPFVQYAFFIRPSVDSGIPFLCKFMPKSKIWHLNFFSRAVVWTDFIQFILMLAAIIVIILLGTNNVGGFANVWSAAERGGRLIMFKYNLIRKFYQTIFNRHLLWFRFFFMSIPFDLPAWTPIHLYEHHFGRCCFIWTLILQQMYASDKQQFNDFYRCLIWERDDGNYSD